MTSLIDTAICHLSERSYSEKELREQLEKKFTHLPDLDKAIDSAVNRLKAQHLLNDVRLAANIAYRYSHKGNRFIERVLEQKGVDAEVIAQVLASLADEPLRALDEARKKLQGNQDEVLAHNLYRFLRGRSFSPSAISAVLQQFTEEGHLTKQRGARPDKYRPYLT